ncbi:hypothetical protein D3C73_1086930 [compost metagenome]
MRFVQIEFQPCHVVGIAVSACLEPQRRHGFQARQVGQRHGRAVAQVHGAGFESDGGGGRVSHYAHDQAVDVGLGLVPVIGVAFIHDVAAAYPFLELVRARADGRRDGGVGQRVSAVEDVFGDDGCFGGDERAYQVGRGFGQAQHHGVVVGRFNGADIRERVAPAWVDLL